MWPAGGKGYFAALIAAGVLDAEPLVERRCALEEADDALAAALARDIITGVIVPSHV